MGGSAALGAVTKGEDQFGPSCHSDRAGGGTPRSYGRVAPVRGRQQPMHGGSRPRQQTREQRANLQVMPDVYWRRPTTARPGSGNAERRDDDNSRPVATTRVLPIRPLVLPIRVVIPDSSFPA